MRWELGTASSSRAPPKKNSLPKPAYSPTPPAALFCDALRGSQVKTPLHGGCFPSLRGITEPHKLGCKHLQAGASTRTHKDRYTRTGADTAQAQSIIPAGNNGMGGLYIEADHARVLVYGARRRHRRRLKSRRRERFFCAWCRSSQPPRRGWVGCKS